MKKINSAFKLLITTCLFLSATGCMTVPGSGRKAFNIIPEGIEKNLGQQSYSSILENEPILKNGRLVDIVTRVGKRIADAANRPDYQWEFKVIDKNVQNAFCLPGGKIAVYKGILSVAKNEAGLATVMGHEVVHALARHGGQRISLNILQTGGMVALSQTALKDNPKGGYIMAALGLGSMVGISLPYGRMQESEADEVGQILMAKAGYDPAESIQFWSRFAQATGGSGAPTFLSTHPSSAGRAENMQDKLSHARTEYEKAPNKYGLGESF